ncbi:MAG: Na(+)/H(+) antiporter NhaD [Elusimicrobia bacterium ADurb.Bin231]|nr:MAG: Na(+)/H(+) antiporter NhaD [Elusimicrobia bacterium ADurb.Bin231]
MDTIINAQLISLIVFLTAYILFIVLPNKRTLISVCGVALLLIFKAISPAQALKSVNWNVMGIFVGTLVVADIFMESRMPAYLAELIVNRAKNTSWAILFICALAGFISAFVENVATVLIVAPIALSLTKKLKINPVNMMIGIAISSNLQGAATLIGDPPSMLLGGYAKMTFFDFFFYKGKPGIFFAVELGALVSLFVLYFFFKGHTNKIELPAEEKIKSWIPTVILSFMIIMLACSSFLDKGFGSLAGIICLIFGGISLLWGSFTKKEKISENIKKLDWDTTFFLMGIFILVGSLTLTGWIDKISSFISASIGSNIFIGYTVIVFLSVFLSAFIDNVPFLVAMLPVAINVSRHLQVNPELLMFGLLIGASIGGNITPIGASANIVACGLLKEEGYTVKFRDFAKIGLPFTLASVIAAYLFIWFVWK